MNFPAAFPASFQDWKSASSDVARASILRDLATRVHTERSVHLASGGGADLAALDLAEANLERWARVEGFPADLSICLTRAPEGPPWKAHPGTEPGLVERFSRPDRVWERRIAREAMLLGWGFWWREGSIPIREVRERHEELLASLKPSAVFLLVESGRDPGSDEPGVWHGRWLFVAPPGFERMGEEWRRVG